MRPPPAAALLAACALLAGCSGSPPAVVSPVAPLVAPPGTTPSVAAPQVGIPISGLVGDWRVQARGELAAHLRVEPTELFVRRSCGDLSGFWSPCRAASSRP